MKRWLKRTLVGLFGASVLFGSLAACSHDGHHRHGWNSMSEEDVAKVKTRVIDKAASRLDLDEAQKAKLGVVADKLREQRNALVAGGDPREQLRGIVAGPQFDRTKAQALIEGKTGSIQTKSPEVVAALADFYDSLRPEQQAKVRDMMARWESRRHGWRS